MARAAIRDQIDMIALNGGSAQVIAGQVDALRHAARAHRLDAVAEIAHHFESALSRGNVRVGIDPFIAALRDAVGCESADPAVISALLAPVSQRLYG